VTGLSHRRVSKETESERILMLVAEQSDYTQNPSQGFFSVSLIPGKLCKAAYCTRSCRDDRPVRLQQDLEDL